jgi:hypothetical protein
MLTAASKLQLRVLHVDQLRDVRQSRADLSAKRRSKRSLRCCQDLTFDRNDIKTNNNDISLDT